MMIATDIKSNKAKRYTRNIMIYAEHKELSEKIIEHLLLKEKMRDDLEGIVVGIYNEEMKKLSERIINSLSDLITKGKITELEAKDGKRIYQLIKNRLPN